MTLNSPRFMHSWVLHLPARGRLLVGTDLQGNLRDFEQLLRHLRAAGDGACLVLTGDLVHGPDADTVAQWPDFLGTPYADESPALIAAFVAAQRELPGRVHCLLGNHDHAHVGGPVTQKFHDDEAANLEARLGPERAAAFRALVGGFPLVAVAPCGLVMTHAAPGAHLSAPAELEGLPYDGFRGDSIEQFLERPVLGPLLWARGAKHEVAEAFLRAVGGTVSVFGHDVVREGFDRDGHRQLCLSTSFGLFDTNKRYLEVDLAAYYPDAHALRDGFELRPLWPAG